MRPLSHHTSLLLALALVLFLLTSCDKTPMGVLSTNEMADLIVDLQLADAYIDSHTEEFDSDSSMLVIKQSVFKKHGITQEEYDSSLVWYSHNMDDYIKAHDKAIGKLKERYDKLSKDIDLTKLKESIMNDMRKIWEEIPKPEQYKNKPCTEYFKFDFCLK